MEERKCQECRGNFPLDKLFCYVDGNNIAITKSSPELCKECYLIKYKLEEK